MPIAKIIAGLGNPGTSHAKQRHNVGFMLADALAEAYGSGAWQKKDDAEVCMARIKEEEVLLVKPQSYMNLSGEPIGKILRFYKLPTEALWVLHDELDLPFAEARIKLGGGSAGHNGLKNISQHIGEDFYRLRFGIAHPRDKMSDTGGDKEEVHNHVLGDFTTEEKLLAERQIAYIVNHIADILNGSLKTIGQS